MPRYNVTIRETVTYEVTVEASSRQQALAAAFMKWETTNPEPDSRSASDQDAQIEELPGQE
ncbi:MAG TPA: DpnD/PcfM family protein [Acetobacteraceae bacterium]|jgi:hypothetical protein|nr:DpnD/PcfM family protein [Acetobacteraceae bacterium]